MYKLRVKLFIVLAFFGAYCIPANGQDILGNWYGHIDVQGTKLPLVFHIDLSGDSLITLMDSPLQSAKDIPVASTIFKEKRLKMQLPALNATYSGESQGDSIVGELMQNGASFPMVLRKDSSKSALAPPNRPQMPKPPFNYSTEEVQIFNSEDSVMLAGTLAEADTTKNRPIVVLITGSGQQNRDEEVFGHKPFWVIADDFAKKGIGTLRLDDRGVGGSSLGKNPSEMTTKSFVGDINEAVKYLTARGYKNIGLVGHSEGGMIGPLVAIQNSAVKFLVLLAAPGVPIPELMADQTYDISIAAGLPEEAAVKEQKKNVILVQTLLKASDTTKLRATFETEISKLLSGENALPQVEKEELYAMIENYYSNAYFKYFLHFKPQEYLSKIKIPVLAINGSKDMQVAAKKNSEGIRKALQKAGNKSYKVLEIENLNHLLQHATTGAISEYVQIEETISPEVLQLMSTWILGQQPTQNSD